MRFLFLIAILCSGLLGHSQLDINDASRKVDALMRLVDRTYVDSVKSDKLAEDAIVGMLKKLDPHSVYISKDEIKKMNEPLVGNFEGVGIQFNIHHDTILVVSPIEGGPSEALGIRSGDKIVTIDNENVAGIGIENKGVMDRLRGKKGTKVDVSIYRRGIKKLLDFTITRDKIPIYSISATFMATPNIGYIKLNRFSATSMTEFRKAVDTLKLQGMDHMILDLRGNSGGYLNTAIRLADQFLPSQKMVVYTKGRSFPKDEKFATALGNFETGKLVVLIDQGSASASEIVSGAVQDWDRGLIVGRRSFGKGLVQKPYPLPDGSAVRLTVSRYYTPTGRSIQKPYENYKDDYTKRFERGELFSADSIEFPDSLKYYTPNKRTVYGGGGIMPDIFVPLDTSMNSTFYMNILRKGGFNEFLNNYLDGNRKQLKTTYSNITAFKNDFTIDEKLMSDFLNFIEEKGVKKDEKDFETSKFLIKTQLKALIARGLWKSSAYFQVFNPINPTYQKAIELINDDTFNKMALNYK